MWLHDRMRSAGVVSAQGIGDASTFNGKAAPTGIQDDRDSTEGFTDDEDAFSKKKLELEDLANGYPDEK